MFKRFFKSFDIKASNIEKLALVLYRYLVGFIQPNLRLQFVACFFTVNFDLSGIEKMRFIISAVAIANPLKRRELSRCLVFILV
ncbi:hypothetical protein C7E22_09480 [Vibrio sp. V02_P2A34T13]|nr:hypothetical protein B9J83_00630 [Vibrio sp. V07_P2A8T137]PSD41713.1 hypothetical protein C7E22_09480 [Vibrio sp. V02_P2A34T13]